jgi:hypothetical protein
MIKPILNAGLVVMLTIIMVLYKSEWVAQAKIYLCKV